DRAPGSWLMIAPAPRMSSAEGRNEPSTRQRSPAGMTAMRRPRDAATAATAPVLRRQPARIWAGGAVSAATAVSVEPLGDGSTSLWPSETASREDGESV